jgi:hypothetical protein
MTDHTPLLYCIAVSPSGIVCAMQDDSADHFDGNHHAKVAGGRVRWPLSDAEKERFGWKPPSQGYADYVEGYPDDEPDALDKQREDAIQMREEMNSARVISSYVPAAPKGYPNDLKRLYEYDGNIMVDLLAERVASSMEGMLSEDELRRAIKNLSVHHPIYDGLTKEMDFSPASMKFHWDSQSIASAVEAKSWSCFDAKHHSRWDTGYYDPQGHPITPSRFQQVTNSSVEYVGYATKETR